MSQKKSVFLAGLIEGFYGRQWSFESRARYAQYLVDLGLNTYLYCPKGDPYLRKMWHQPWPDSQFSELQALCDTYQSRSLFWGVGLSPFALYQNYGALQRRQVRAKVLEIRALGASVLAILFDDMPGAQDDLAGRQAEIVADVQAWAGDMRVVVCPTYYSFDPVLEKHFGKRPDDYWQRLGRDLQPDVDVFWTGNQVCSAQILAADITAITDLMGRPVMLWDNYPVNDGAVRSRRLYCEPLSARSGTLQAQLSGHLCNPMNQAMLSLSALTGLAALYGRERDERWLEAVLGEQFWQQLRADRALFQEAGLDGIDLTDKQQLAAHYDLIPGLAAQEVSQWLRGEYAFDPGCLTD